MSSVHRLYYTDYEISTAEYKTNKPRLMPFQYNDGDDVLRRARQILELGGTVWEIESDDGAILNRYQISIMLQQRATELSTPPKV